MITHICAILLTTSLLAGSASSAATKAAEAGISASASDQTLQRLMDQVRSRSLVGKSAEPNGLSAAPVSTARLQERAELLKTGEAALARLDLEAALQAFERASLILHAADTEIALVRSYMQRGEYRRALAFGAHTAGAHLDVVGGAALYGWLLQSGGQPAVAQRLLTEAEARVPGSPLVKSVQQQLRSGAPLATGPLLQLPARLAPYSSSPLLPASARVVGSGVLLASGGQALVPLALIPVTGKIWLRNGLGQLTTASMEKRLPVSGLALLKLQTALTAPEEFTSAAHDAFPGSVGFAVEYVAAMESVPAWPVLRTGFLGAAVTNGQGKEVGRPLGIEMPPGPRGGPVFNASGQFIGLALPGKQGQADLLVPVSQVGHELRNAGGEKLVAALGWAPAKDIPARWSVDKIYETSLKASLQLITVP